MIFITAGTQAPFDRLIKAVDIIAASFPDDKFVAQTISGRYRPKHIELTPFLSPQEFDLYLNTADLVVGHAGIGTIITALTKNKPLLVLPRRLDLGEHTSDHQAGTANRFSELGYARVMNDEQELITELTRLLNSREFKPQRTIGPWASEELINALKKDIATHEIQRSR